MDYHAVYTIIAWAVTAALLVIFIPKERIREAALVYMFILFLTWLLGLTVVELGLRNLQPALSGKQEQTAAIPALRAVLHSHHGD
jgi:Na+/melibiose symporter-like transporter